MPVAKPADDHAICARGAHVVEFVDRHLRELARGSEMVSKAEISKFCSSTIRGTYMSCFPALAIVQQHPIVDTVILITGGLQHLGEKLSKEIVVWTFFKTKLSNIIHIDCKLL